MPPKLRSLLAVLGATLLLDQASKIWTVASLAYRGPPLDARAQAGLASLGHAATNPAKLEIIPGWLAFEHSQNPAAAMGMMLGVEHRMLVFAAFTLVATVVLGMMYRALPTADRVQAASIGFLLAGTFGNAIDRLHKGTVTDFIEFTMKAEPLRTWMIHAIGTNVWYTFNVADAAIFVGVGLYLVATLFTRDTPEDEAGPSPLDTFAETTP
jgi:signal peptidase II